MNLHYRLVPAVLVVSFLVGFSLTSGNAQAQDRDSTQSGQPNPTPTSVDTPDFPVCQDLLASGPGNYAHYGPGNWHQIVGGPLLSGSDDVYTLDNGNYVQCFCPDEGAEGIQTNWWKTLLQSLEGWLQENGVQWNLGDHNFLAQNSSFSCDPTGEPQGEVTPTPTPTQTPEPTAAASDPTPTPKNEVGGASAFAEPTSTSSPDSAVGGYASTGTLSAGLLGSRLMMLLGIATTGHGPSKKIKPNQA